MQKLICLFNNKATKDQLMTTNGDFILNPICTSSIVTEKTNEDFSCQFSFQLNKEYEKEINALVEDNIIRVQDEEGEECFRIVNVTKNTKTIDVFTVHITIRDIINMWLEDVRPTNQSGQGALSWIFDNAKGGNNFNVTSNITGINTAFYNSMSVYNALYNADNSFLNRWGGETRRRGFNIAINDRIGTDRGMQIRSKKNITGFDARTNLDSLCTCLYVKGFDGIKLDQPINSPLINNYSKPYFKEIKFEDIKVKDANNPNEGFDTLALAQAEMLKRGTEQFTKGNIDVIKATYNIKFAQLEKTEEYKNYSMIETAFLGDTVEVIEDNYNINIKVRVVARVFDVLKQERVETTLSNIDTKERPMKVEDLLKELENSKDANGNADLSAYIDSMMNSGIKDSYVVMKANELLIMDSKDINTAKNVCRYNKNGMGFSQNGIFGKYEYGFTIDGKINASMISTGVLSAILLQSANGNTKIDLNSGKISFKNGGFIGNDTCYWDLDTQVIKGNNILIDLLSGNVNFKKGKIEGLNSSWDLTTGIIKFSKGVIEGSNSSWDLDKGVIRCSQPDGSEVVMSAVDGFYHKTVGGSNNKYHSLSYTQSGSVQTNDRGEFEVTISLPSEFKGSGFKVVPTVDDYELKNSSGIGVAGVMLRNGVWVKAINPDGGVTIRGQCAIVDFNAKYDGNFTYYGSGINQPSTIFRAVKVFYSIIVIA